MLALFPDVPLDALYVFTQHRQGQLRLAKTVLHRLQQARLFYCGAPGNLFQHGREQFVPIAGFSILGDGRYGEFNGRLRRCEQFLEIFRRLACGEEVVHIYLRFAQQAFGLRDILGGSALEQFLQFPRPGRGLQSERPAQLFTGGLLCRTKGERNDTGFDARFGQPSCGAQRAFEPGFGQFVVLADVDRLHAAQFQNDAVPVIGAYLYGYGRDGWKASLHQRNAVGDALCDDQA